MTEQKKPELGPWKAEPMKVIEERAERVTAEDAKKLKAALEQKLHEAAVTGHKSLRERYLYPVISTPRVGFGPFEDAWINEVGKLSTMTSTKAPSPAVVPTHGGGTLDILQPDPRDIGIDDIAHHLARVNRFTGAIKFEQYSVAQHSVICSWAARLIAPELELHALLHDAHEAYIGDISTPMKRAIQIAGGRDVIDRIEKPIIGAVWHRLGCKAPRNDQIIHAIDVWAAWREVQDVLENAHGSHWNDAFKDMRLLSDGQLASLSAQIGPIKGGWSAGNAKTTFLDMYRGAVSRWDEMQKMEAPQWKG